MEELERVRTTTAGELNRQLAELGERRNELEAELARRQAEISEKDLELELSRVNVALDVLFETVDREQSYRIADDAENLTEIVDLTDDDQLELLFLRLRERNDPTIDAAVYFAIYTATQKNTWLDDFIQAATPISRIETEWLSEAGWQTTFPFEAWGRVAELALDQINQGTIETGRDVVNLRFLEGILPDDIRRNSNRMEIPNFWRFVVANVDTLKVDTRNRFGGRDFGALSTLYEVAPAAAHVWMYKLSENASILPEDREWLSSEVERLIDRGMSLTKPIASIEAFWSDPLLIDRASDYGTIGTSMFYENLIAR